MVNSPVVSTADSASGWSSPGVAQLPCVPSRSLLTVPPGWSSTLVPCWGRPSALPVRTPVPVRQVLASHRYQPNHHDGPPGRPALRSVPDARGTSASRPRGKGGPHSRNRDEGAPAPPKSRTPCVSSPPRCAEQLHFRIGRLRRDVLPAAAWTADPQHDMDNPRCSRGCRRSPAPRPQLRACPRSRRPRRSRGAGPGRAAQHGRGGFRSTPSASGLRPGAAMNSSSAWSAAVRRWRRARPWCSVSPAGSGRSCWPSPRAWPC